MTRLALVGAGLVGQRHAQAIEHVEGVSLVAAADPSPAALTTLGEHVAARASLTEILVKDQPDGVVLATPTPLHAAQSLEAIAAGVPVLVEKPIAASVDEGRRVVEAAEASGVPLLVGHHRRHNAIVSSAKATITAGRLGRITAAHTMFWLHKPNDYFNADWRRHPGGGPVMINLIHDVDLLRHLVGGVAQVMAFTSNAARGFAVEDGAAVILGFQNGALGTINASDATTAPWSWELTAGENPAYPKTEETGTVIGGTHGSIAIPANRVWHHPYERSWWAPIACEAVPLGPSNDPLVRQIENFKDVIAAKARPLVSGEDGLGALAIIEAILASAATGKPTAPAA